MAGFAVQRDGIYYMTEGGQETEIMYKHGHDLPQFAMYPLLQSRAGLADLRGMYERYLETVARHDFIALMGGLDYRASPDWGGKLGYSKEQLADIQLQSIEFLRDVAKPFAGQIRQILIVGIVGPRGDAYKLNRDITSEEAEDYHSVQLHTLKQARVDLVSGMTFNNTAEAVGLSRAAATAGLPLAIHFTLDSTNRLKSGPSLRDAILAVDAECGDSRPDFYGINCSHPNEFMPALEPGDWIRRIRSLRPNASSRDKMDLCKIGYLEDGDPVELGGQLGELSRRYPHIDVWGGCCGTWERHLDQIATNLRRHRH